MALLAPPLLHQHWAGTASHCTPLLLIPPAHFFQSISSLEAKVIRCDDYDGMLAIDTGVYGQCKKEGLVIVPSAGQDSNSSYGQAVHHKPPGFESLSGLTADSIDLERSKEVHTYQGEGALLL